MTRSMAACSRGAKGTAMTVLQEPSPALKVRSATSRPSGSVSSTRRVRVSRAMAMRVTPAILLFMLPEVSRTSSSMTPPMGTAAPSAGTTSSVEGG